MLAVLFVILGLLSSSSLVSSAVILSNWFPLTLPNGADFRAIEEITSSWIQLVLRFLSAFVAFFCAAFAWQSASTLSVPASQIAKTATIFWTALKGSEMGVLIWYFQTPQAFQFVYAHLMWYFKQQLQVPPATELNTATHAILNRAIVSAGVTVGAVLAFGLTGALLLWSFEKYLSEGNRYAVELGRDEPSQFQRIGLPADLEQGLMTHRSSSGIQLVH